MSSVNLCFRVHLPYRLANAAESSRAFHYFDDEATAAAANRLADDCYLPANAILGKLIKEHKGKFSVSFSISGTTLEILQRHRPNALASFRALAATGSVDFLAETYYNSLSWLYSKKEFCSQVKKHSATIHHLFGIQPTVLRNTELIYNNQLAVFAADMGYKAVLCEGLEKILQGQSLNQAYQWPEAPGLALLLRNGSLSDDIAFRFDEPGWVEQPVTADKYAGWLHQHSEPCSINVLMDYETFGVHKKKSSGIFEFLQHLPAAILSNEQWEFNTAAKTAATSCPAAVYDVPTTISWRDKEIENCVWCDNMMQNNMLKKIYSLETMLATNGNEESYTCWQRLQSADHFYHMSATARTANDAYQQLNPFATAEAAYKCYLNIITDFEIQLIERGLQKYKTGRRLSNKPTLY